MVDTRGLMLGLSGGFFLIGALCFIIDFGPDEALMFGLMSLTGALLMFVGLLMKNHVDAKNVRNAARLVIGAGIVIFLVSALIDWNPMELLMLVTCGAYSIIVYALSLRPSLSE